MRPRLPFFGLACAAIFGVLLADRCAFTSPPLFAAFAVCGLTALLWPRTWLCLVATLLAFAALHTAGHREHPAREIERALLAGPQITQIEGVVASDPEPLPFFSRHQTGTFRLKLDAPHAAVVQTTWAGPLPRYGDRVTMHGSLEALEPPRNPGQLDFAEHLRRAGVFARFEAKYAQDCHIAAHDAGNPVLAFAIRASHWMQTQLALDLEDSPELAALIASMVLGLRGDTPDEMQDVFRTTGTMHLFAVSGLNIAMLAIIAAYVLKPLGVGRRLAPVIIIPILVFYALVTGLSASCVRAMIMGSLVLLALVLERRTVVYNSLAAAAVLILAWDTNQLFIPGFQFSFVLVFTIVWLADKISRRFEKLGHPDPFLPQPLWNSRQRALAWSARLLAASLGVTISAWFGSLAFTAGYFHIFSPSALFANLVAVPIAFVILALGIATLLAAPVAKPLAVIFSNANWLCAKALLGSVKVFAVLPGGHLYVELPRLTPPPAGEITVLDVGEGAAIHLRTGGAEWLIDGGSTHYYANVTLPYLRSRGVNRLNAMLLTHGDAQHIASAVPLLDDFTPRVVFDSTVKDRSSTRRTFHTELTARRRGEAFARRGDSFQLGALTVRVLFPPAGWQRSIADDKTLVLAVEGEGQRVLLMSDSGFATEHWLVENEPDLRADVIVKGHHVSDFSGTAEFFAHVQPSAVVVGEPGFARQPQPFDAWARETEARGIAVFRQDRCGAVTLTLRDGALELRGFVNGQTFRSRAR